MQGGGRERPLQVACLLGSGNDVTHYRTPAPPWGPTSFKNLFIVLSATAEKPSDLTSRKGKWGQVTRTGSRESWAPKNTRATTEHPSYRL